MSFVAFIIVQWIYSMARPKRPLKRGLGLSPSKDSRPGEARPGEARICFSPMKPEQDRCRPLAARPFPAPHQTSQLEPFKAPMERVKGVC